MGHAEAFDQRLPDKPKKELFLFLFFEADHLPLGLGSPNRFRPKPLGWDGTAEPFEMLSLGKRA